jgi:hypothetical protein
MGGWKFKANLGKKLARPYLKEQAVCVVVCACNSSYSGGKRDRVYGHILAKMQDPN